MDDTRVEEGQQTLLLMGFSECDAKAALQITNGNVEQAIEMILSGQLSHNTNDESYNALAPPVSSLGPARRQRFGSPRYIHCETSQYSSPSGRSACTYIALTVALQTLGSLQSEPSSPPKNLTDVLTSTTVEDHILKGISSYNTDKSTSSTIEHTSAEEVLSSSDRFTPLKLIGGSVRQGILSAPNLRFSQILSACYNDGAADGSKWMAVVITKTPETIVIFLPPHTTREGDESFRERSFAIVDSHPRPELQCSGSYVAVYDCFDGLVGHLEGLFRAVDLGADVGEMMMVMYNSFDAYPLQLL
mmetsp:Transcript_40778/g.49648  ORF Transcript_40778/g.49648 Transcript_40778/m.49648 type:complete len:303 (-) Transcript_40778:74-982(-)|eukprot:CAMPEP_0172514330 /NCGR_PEP_ID=MMETSP1066-20121228/259351_1 /TAXON_ID=671091 /ORGANISM="Coscinodiscus wailesii, Strain CCMP2513" /LENGTH=302 /DNA_ID=CAMNT_0013294957 /DNA_START=51 /DNA_END=962 /DNA_ORIENTATION=-